VDPFTDLDAIRARLSGRDHRRHDGPATRRAAVAAVLRPGAQGAEVLLIRRAEREGDPWSGHMAFPGGHEEPGDRDLLATARRETVEEVGLPLGDAQFLGPLDEFPAIARGRFTGMLIAPFVFGVEADPPLRPNHEVAAVRWAPLSAMARGEYDVVKEVERDGALHRYPGFRVGKDVVWGLTHRMLRALFEALRAP